MKSNRCSAIWALTLLVAFSLKACNKEEMPEGSITMTTTATQVRISLSGSEDIVIHWGDGSKSNLNAGTFLDFAGQFEFFYTYSSAATHKIIIAGKVDELDCKNNQLTALDVSLNVELTSLNCSDNQLNALEVNRNKALTTLVCSNNKLRDLEVGQNTALEELNMSGNQITTIDVRNNISLKDLRCANNLITNIDVSANIGLIVLDLNRNQLTKLDVSKNTSLGIICIRGNQLRASALNDLFKTLYNVPEGEYAFIDYTGNPGSNDADHGIWQEKDWLYDSCH